MPSQDDVFEDLLRVHWPPERWADVPVLVAVSGGADSVALLRAIDALAKRMSESVDLQVAHVNHCLRGEESDADEAFVRALAEDLGRPCHVERWELDEASSSASESLEARARELRYRFFRRLAGERGFRYVVTAHTAEDQAETVLHHLLRGTGIAGLAGISRARPLIPGVSLIRPMLGLRKHQIHAYLRRLGQSWREDRSNRDPKFTRNRIRHRLLPLLEEEYHAGATESILRLSDQVREIHDALEAEAATLLEACVSEATRERVVLRCEWLGKAPRHLVREMMVLLWKRQEWPLQEMGFAEWDLLEKMTRTDRREPEQGRAVPAKRMFPGAVLAERAGDRLVLAVHRP